MPMPFSCTSDQIEKTSSSVLCQSSGLCQFLSSAATSVSVSNMGGSGGQQYCLRWNNHRSNLLTVFEQLLETEAFTDVTLAVGGASIKCHKMVLAACSSYFQSLFVDNTCPHPIVVFKDIQYAEIRAILEFMYRGEVNVAQEQVGALLKAAEALKVKGLYSEDSTQSGLSGISFEPTSIHGPGFLASSSAGVPRKNLSLLTCASLDSSGTPNQAARAPVTPAGRFSPQRPQSRTPSGTPERNVNGKDHQREGSTSSEHTPVEEERDETPALMLNDMAKRVRSPAFPDVKDMQNGPTLGSFGTKSSRPELKRYRQYTRHDIAAAIDAVRSGMSALQASRLYGVPSRTLYDKVKKLGIVTGRPYRQSIAVAVSLAQGGNLAGVSPRDDDDSMDVKEAPRFHGLGRVNPLEELGLYFTPTDLALGRADESRHLSRPDAIPAPIDLSQSYERMLRADGDNQRSTESEKTEISEKSA